MHLREDGHLKHRWMTGNNREENKEKIDEMCEALKEAKVKCGGLCDDLFEYMLEICLDDSISG